MLSIGKGNLEPFHSTGLRNQTHFSSTGLENLQPFPSIGLGNLHPFPTGERIEPFPSSGLGNLEPFSSIGLEKIYNLYLVMDRETYRTHPSASLVLEKGSIGSPVQYWKWFKVPNSKTGKRFLVPQTSEPMEPFASTGLGNLEYFSSIGLENIYNLYSVLDRGTYRTFSQYWTWDLIEPYSSTAWNGDSRKHFSVMD